MVEHRREEFAEAAAEYCAWCEGRTGSELEEARAALRHLSRLYLLAQGLREVEDAPEVEVDHLNDAAWRSAYERFAALPFSYYASIFDPRSILTGEPEVETGDLGDDLADVYRDLSNGRSLFRAGHTEAAEWEWAWSFRNHWGRHAASAIHALHCWFADEGEW